MYTRYFWVRVRVRVCELRWLKTVSRLQSNALMKRIGTTTILYHVLTILSFVVPNEIRIITEQDAVIIVM